MVELAIGVFVIFGIAAVNAGGEQAEEPEKPAPLVVEVSPLPANAREPDDNPSCLDTVAELRTVEADFSTAWPQRTYIVEGERCERSE